MDATADQGGTSGRPVTNARRYSASRRARSQYPKRRHRAFAALVGVMLPVVAAPADAQADTKSARAGACVVTLTLTHTPAAPRIGDSVTWNVNGGGPCAQTGSSTLRTGTLSGSLSSVPSTPAGCAGGVLEGTITVDVSDAFAPVATEVTAAMAGAVLVLAGDGNATFVGGGSFANVAPPSLTGPPTTDLVECALGADGQARWTGVYSWARVASTN